MSSLSRPTWVEVDLGAIAHNMKLLRSTLKPGVALLAQVKGNAYGHGLLDVARAYERLGVDWLGVASIDEAARLRDGGITKSLLVQTAILPEEAGAALEYRVQPAVCSVEVGAALDRAASARNTVATVHLKIDTGMGRLGVWHEEAEALAKRLQAFRRLRIAGCFTHFPSAEDDRRFTTAQIAAFRKLLARLRKMLDAPVLGHAANSMALLSYPDSHCDLVRPGLAFFGLYPTPRLRRTITLQPALSWKTRIVFVKRVPAGRGISYGLTHTTRRPTVIATLPVGYADGYMRALSNRSVVLIRGQRASVVGRICMDQVMVDVGRIANVQVGDEAVLIGTQGDEEIRAEELAHRAGTIAYEICTSISDRVPRRYIGQERLPIAVDGDPGSIEKPSAAIA